MNIERSFDKGEFSDDLKGKFLKYPKGLAFNLI